MSQKEQVQEDQYVFPYHYLTSTSGDNFTLSQYLQWGLMHASYLNFLKEKIEILKPASLFDAGCGDGRVIFELEKKIPNCKLTGVDISKRALYFARGFTKNANFIEQDITEKPIIDLHDVCISIEVIEHIPPKDIPKYIENISKSLTEKGVFILTTPTTNLPTQKKHYQHFTKKILGEYLGSHFNIVEVEYINKENYVSRLIARILANKYFILNQQYLKNLLYRLYCKKYLYADEFTGSRIYVKAIKK